MFCMSMSVKENNNNFNSFSVWVLLLLCILLLTFSTSDFLAFFILFEGSLIPIFLLILGWGYQPERVPASNFLLFYTLTASLPLLLALLKIQSSLQSLDFSVLISLGGGFSSLVFLAVSVAFLVKIPLYLIHLWLPKAHVEAPVAGSMILAGVLLKLGAYGIIRVYSFIFFELKGFSLVFASITLVGGVISSLICLRQTDVKALVAYSSVAHISLVILGVTIDTKIALRGMIVVLIAHGLRSSGLFRLVGIIYTRTGTRRILLIRRSITLAPVLSF